MISFNTIVILTVLVIKSGSVCAAPRCDLFDVNTNAATSMVNILFGSFLTCPLGRPYTTLPEYLKFFLVTSENAEEVSITADDVIKRFQNASSITAVIHGYLDRSNSDWMVPVARGHAEATGGLGMVIDYSLISSCFYTEVALEFIPRIARFIANLFNEWKIENEVVLVGHSLGAHAVGICGDAMNKKPDKIIALDPAGPLFSSSNKERLHPNAAKIVQVMHTDPLLLGNNDLLGTVDYFMNDRYSEQPGCGTSACSHMKSIDYHFSLLFPEVQLDCPHDDASVDQSNCRPGIYDNGAECTGSHTCKTTTKCFPYFKVATT